MQTTHTQSTTRQLLVMLATVLIAAVSQVSAQTANAEQPAWKTLTPEIFTKLPYNDRKGRPNFDNGTRGLIMMFKQKPELLDDKGTFLYWVGLNDCEAVKLHDDEFEWPAIEKFYKSKLAGTLKALPPLLYAAFNVRLGTYDMATHSFEIEYGYDKQKVMGFDIRAGNVVSCGGNIPLPPMTVKFSEALPTRFTVSEEIARDFVKQHSHDRRATMQLTFLVSDLSTNEASQDTGRGKQVVFVGKINYAGVTASFDPPGGFGALQDRYLGHLIPATDAAMYDEKLRPNDYERGSVEPVFDAPQK